MIRLIREDKRSARRRKDTFFMKHLKKQAPRTHHVLNNTEQSGSLHHQGPEDFVTGHKERYMKNESCCCSPTDKAKLPWDIPGRAGERLV
mmetsp:Transcript_40524/g.63370  ORF Transcript_40524/g.63370 Transcript_40524/m.63370 type:complete len:90 (-) Transcript_40524:23-292(-)